MVDELVVDVGVGVGVGVAVAESFESCVMLL